MRYATLALVTCLAGCASVPKIHFAMQGGPDDALVHINDRYIGKLGRLEKTGINLEPGEYRVTIDAVGYFPHDELVTVDPAKPPPALSVELEQVPD